MWNQSQIESEFHQKHQLKSAGEKKRLFQMNYDAVFNFFFQTSSIPSKNTIISHSKETWNNYF